MPANTSAFDEPAQPAPPGAPWRARRSLFRTWLHTQRLPGITSEEVEAHFGCMPDHYWEGVSETDLRRGLETVHGFLETTNSLHTAPTNPFVSFCNMPEALCTQVMISTWDRHGLLAKTAAAFSAARLNIIQAEAYTRNDHIVLDVFRVSEPDSMTPANPARLRDMTFILDGALSEPPRFASLWACSRHKYLAKPSRMPPAIHFDNEPARATLMRINAVDRLGLLYDILQALADGGLNIIEARIKTDQGLAHDEFHVLDAQGHKLIEPERQNQIRRGLESALTLPEFAP